MILVKLVIKMFVKPVLMLLLENLLQNVTVWKIITMMELSNVLSVSI